MASATDGDASERDPGTLAGSPLSGLAATPNGLFLSAALSTLDDAALTGAERLEAMRGWARLVAYAESRLFAAMASIVDAVVEDQDIDLEHPTGLAEAAESAAVEIAATLHLTRRAAERDLEFALGLRRRLPAVLAALEDGRLDRRRAAVFLRGTSHLSVAEARSVVDDLIERTPHWTTGQLRARLQRAVMAADPDAAHDRYRDALDERRVVVEPTEAGTATLVASDLPADRAHAARRRIEALARDLASIDEGRTLDQLRADVFLDLLLGTRPGDQGASGGVHLTIDLGTLAGLNDDPGELNGYGPVVADVARQIAADQPAAGWTWAVVDPDGAVAATGITRRRPRTGTRRGVTARRPRCVFPGCRVPAVDSDLDHTIPWSEGGRTSSRNLQPLCRHHHVHRHRGWRYVVLDDGRIRWTSPLGRTVDVLGDATSRPPP